MKEIVRVLPQYDYLYLGDNARTPYGNRSTETVTQFSREAVEFLFKAGAQMIIFACYTASALALRELQKEYPDRKILGVIRPVVEKAAKTSRNGMIGVTGTRGTIASNTFVTELHNQKPGLRVFQQACPLLVPLIEENWHKKPEAQMILKKYLRPLKSKNIDTLILGCTHYSVMMKDFKRMMGKRIQVLDSGKIVAESLRDYLKRHPEIEKKLTRDGGRKFCTTDDTERFKVFTEAFWSVKVNDLSKVTLTQ